MNDSREINYLNVPYEERGVARRNGALWDKDARSWSVVGEIPEELQKYAAPRLSEEALQALQWL